jgi:hypothetical protein
MNLRSLLGSWAAPLLIHNQNQNTAMIRAAAAKAQGLDPNIYGVPLPGSNVTTTNNQSGFVKGALISAAMIAGGAGASSLLPAVTSAISGTPAAATKPATAAPATTPVASNQKPTTAYEAIIEQQQPDGTWKQISSQKLEPPQ